MVSVVSPTRPRQEHFPSDVLIGAAAGWMIRHYVFEIHQIKHISSGSQGELQRSSGSGLSFPTDVTSTRETVLISDNPRIALALLARSLVVNKSPDSGLLEGSYLLERVMAAGNAGSSRGIFNLGSSIRC
jgi:hypothetical protein